MKQNNLTSLHNVYYPTFRMATQMSVFIKFYTKLIIPTLTRVPYFSDALGERNVRLGRGERFHRLHIGWPEWIF